MMYPFSPYIYIAFGFVFSFLACYRLIPIVINIAKAKKLYDEPNTRSVHRVVTPSLGGVAIFIGFALSLLIFSNGFMLHELKYIIAATLIMFGLGIKDDLLSISPRKKLAGQITAALIVIILGDIRLTHLHGILGIYELNYVVSVLMTVFVVIVITNGFNLIDGIDGLASGVSGLCTISFGVWFYLTKNYEYVIIASCLLGALMAFFRFNVFGKKNKIFMGDTGSLVLGLLISILVIRFNELNVIPNFKFAIHSAPAVSFGILFVPLFDTIRVMYIRVLNNKSPFKPDNNHFHHRLLTLGYNHLSATLLIMGMNLIFITLAFILSDIRNIYLLAIEVLLGAVFFLIPSYLIHYERLQNSPENDNASKSEKIHYIALKQNLKDSNPFISKSLKKTARGFKKSITNIFMHFPPFF